MKLSADGLELIKKWEGLRLTAYTDVAGVWTIGYGHTYGVTEGMVITKDAADLLLLMDVRDAEDAVNRRVTVELNQSEFDALVSWTFNLGEGHLKSSTMLTDLNAGNRFAVTTQMARWIYAAGVENDSLRERRRDEVRMWEGTWTA